MRVLLMEPELSLRQMLAFVMERQGLEVDHLPPDDLSDEHLEEGYDAIVFNADRRCLGGAAGEITMKAPRGTRLVCFSRSADEMDIRPSEVDAHLPFPFSSSELLGALLGIRR